MGKKAAEEPTGNSGEDGGKGPESVEYACRKENCKV